MEGSQAQYSWLVPHDPAGLFASMGGRAAALARLDRFFTELNAGPASEHAFLSNEPNLGTPWLYDWLGRPDSTQRVVRRALLELYGPGPDGLPGNDDGGTMGAWWVFGALGHVPGGAGHRRAGAGQPALPARGDPAAARHAAHRRPAGGARDAPTSARSRSTARTWRRPWLRYRRICRRRAAALRARRRRPPAGVGPGLAPPSFTPPGG